MGGRVFSFVSAGSSLGGVFNLVLSLGISFYLGEFVSYAFCGVCALIGLVLCCFMQTSIDWSPYYVKVTSDDKKSSSNSLLKINSSQNLNHTEDDDNLK